MRHREAKLRLLEFIKAEPAFFIAEMTEGLQFGSQAMAFASSASGNKLFTAEEVGYNLNWNLKSKRKTLT